MKTLIRRLSRVADYSSSSSSSSSSSTQYNLLRSDARTRRRDILRAAISKSARRSFGAGCANNNAVPEGHVPVYVGDEMERFVVNAELLNHPIFIGLLNKSAQEYGYEQKGVLRIPCHVLDFERVMEALRLGLQSRDLDDILVSLSDELF